jgi:hypothetical protein
VYCDFTDSAKQFLDLFEKSWRKLNPQLRAVLRMMGGRRRQSLP